ncbi:MAG TPA: ABC transporter permease, partial [Bryobacteraceae bacterium]|nr:ABC transporter permease [Bryobacteraceae bacterium]
FTVKEFRSRYRASILGLLWTVLLPLATVFALGFMLFFISRANPREWGAAFLGGYLAWSLMLTATSIAVGSIVANSVYVSRIYAPKGIFPLSAFLVGAVEFVAFFFAVSLLLVCMGGTIYPTFALLPLATLVYAPFVLGCCYLLAVANVFWRDTTFIWAALSTLWFFFTPILYPITAVPAQYRPLFEANPLYPFVLLFQNIFLGTVPPAELWITAMIIGVLTLAVGASLFRRNEERFYLYL